MNNNDWFETPAGRFALDWEQKAFDESVVDIFGYHALQIGLDILSGLRSCRIQRKWQSMDAYPSYTKKSNSSISHANIALIHSFTDLPFSENSLDLVLMPHTLEQSSNPHATLREIERILRPEGSLIISGFNPASLWGARQRRSKIYNKLGLSRWLGQTWLPDISQPIGYWRLRDWLNLLAFDISSVKFGLYRPSLEKAQWLHNLAWLESLGEKFWPFFGSIYFLTAIKRVHSMRLIEAHWRTNEHITAKPVNATISNNINQNT